MKKTTKILAFVLAAATLLSVSACNPFSNTIDIPVTEETTTSAKGRPNPWTDSDTLDKALTYSAIDSFEVAPVKIGGEEIQLLKYRSMEGMLEADYFYGAVELYIRKGKPELFNPDQDVSGDYTNYSNVWTLDCDGIKVTCKGNREGAATVSIWSSDNYDYAVLAYGAGGDTDYGLKEDEVKEFVKGVK